jgi:hypothetical protein
MGDTTQSENAEQDSCEGPFFAKQHDNEILADYGENAERRHSVKH